jgi:hypothetical protein
MPRSKSPISSSRKKSSADRSIIFDAFKFHARAGAQVEVNLAPLRNGDKGGALKKITVGERNLTLNADIRDAEGVIKE